VIKASVATVASLAKPQMVGLSDMNFGIKLSVNEIKIYPNPSSKVIWIKHNLTKVEKTKLKIYNVCGKIIRSLKKLTDSKMTRLDISALSPGIYFVELTNDIETATGKIIIR